MPPAVLQPTLFLVRHARAGGPRAGERDFDRTLDETGQADAAKMAAALTRRGWSLGDIVCSPARRCRETAVILSRDNAPGSLAFEDALYDGAVEAYQAALESLATDGPITLVGHNPVIEQLAWACLGSAVASRALPAGILPGMVIAIARSADSLSGRLVEVIVP